MRLYYFAGDDCSAVDGVDGVGTWLTFVSGVTKVRMNCQSHKVTLGVVTSNELSYVFLMRRGECMTCHNHGPASRKEKCFIKKMLILLHNHIK